MRSDSCPHGSLEACARVAAMHICAIVCRARLHEFCHSHPFDMLPCTSASLAAVATSLQPSAWHYVAASVIRGARGSGMHGLQGLLVCHLALPVVHSSLVRQTVRTHHVSSAWQSLLIALPSLCCPMQCSVYEGWPQRANVQVDTTANLDQFRVCSSFRSS
jgi:hypothetical protein